jgi:hypothetical protein
LHKVRLIFSGILTSYDPLKKCLEGRRKPQRHKGHKGHKGLDVISIFVAASEEEIKKMDKRAGSTERVCYPSF